MAWRFLALVVLMTSASPAFAEGVKGLEVLPGASVRDLLGRLDHVATSRDLPFLVTIYREFEFGECDGTPESCPNTRLYFVVSTYDEAPDINVYVSEWAKEWSFRRWEVSACSESERDTSVIVEATAKLIAADRSQWFRRQQFRIALSPWQATIEPRERISAAVEPERLVLLRDDADAQRVKALAREFFLAVKARDISRVAALADEDAASWLREALSDPKRPEYGLLFTCDGSPGRAFAGWQVFQWLAASREGSKEHGNGILLCMARSGEREWPPAATSLRKLQQAHSIYCSETYEDEGRRVMSFGFLHVGEGVLPEEAEPTPEQPEEPSDLRLGPWRTGRIDRSLPVVALNPQDAAWVPRLVRAYRDQPSRYGTNAQIHLAKVRRDRDLELDFFEFYIDGVDDVSAVFAVSRSKQQLQDNFIISWFQR
jgi:hypothetical protein